MDINDLIYTDAALAVIDGGTWVDMSDEAPGLELLVTGLLADDAHKLMLAKQAKVRMRNRGKPLTDSQYSQCTKEVLAEAVLKGWRGLKDGGNDVAYTPELAAKWLLSRNGERFASLVLAAAQRVDASAQEFVEDASKN